MAEENEKIEDQKPAESPYEIVEPPDEDVAPAKAEAKEPEKPPEEKPEEKPGTKEPVWATSLLDRAKAAGISADEAKDYDTPKSLAKALDLIDRQIARQAREQQEPAAKKETTSTEAKKKYSEKLREKDPDHWDDKFLEVLDDITETYEKQIEELRGNLGHLAQAEQNRQMEAYFDRVDKWFSDLGDERLGKDGRRSLKNDSESFKARVEVLEQAEALAAGYQRMGREIPSEEELLMRAYRSLHGGPKNGEENKPAKPKPGREPVARASNGQTTQPVKGDALARRNLALRLREKGLMDDQVGDEVADIFAQ